MLAATDRHAKAAAEMAVLSEAFPAYPFLARAELRVGLVSRARRGDLAGAARLVAGDTDDVPRSLRDETLANLVRASAHPKTIGAGEVQRLSDELRFDADLRAWLKAVAPGPLRAFEAQGAFGPVRLVPDARATRRRSARRSRRGRRRPRNKRRSGRCGNEVRGAPEALRDGAAPPPDSSSPTTILASLRHARGGDLPGGLPLPVAAGG